MTLTISVVASILIIGALIASPDAYSDKNNNDVLDECKCDKPDTLKVHLTVPDGEKGTEFRIDIFKKLDDRGDLEKRLFPIPVFEGDESLMISASSFAKDKLESNTAFVVYEVDGATDPEDSTKFVDKEVALMEIHTSCSKPLFIGMTVFDVNDPSNGYSLEVLDGLKETERSIPEFEPNSCEDEKKKSTGSITVRKAVNNDNGGEATFESFTISVTNVDTPESPIVLDQKNMANQSYSQDVPAGTYILSETSPDGYNTVMVAGDTGCPSTVNEPFTIKKNKNLSCTIYNDDDGSSGGTGGIIFQNNSLQILLDAVPDEDTDNDGIRDVGDNTYDSCVVDYDENDVPVRKSAPCIEIIDSFTIAIVDPELGVNTRTIVLFSVVEDEINNETIGAIDPQCLIERLIPYSAFTSNTADTNLAVVLSCPNINSGEVLNVNYVMIDPLL